LRIGLADHAGLRSVRIDDIGLQITDEIAKLAKRNEVIEG